MPSSKQSSSFNENFIGLGKSFLENSNKVPAPVFREITNGEFLMVEEHEIYQSIKILSKDLSHLP